MKRPEVSIVVPVFNERATVEELLRQVQAVDLEKEIIVVDDGSTDGTRELLTARTAQGEMRAGIEQQRMGTVMEENGGKSHHGAPTLSVTTASPNGAELRTDNLRIFFQERNQGKGAALRRGFQEALGEIVIVQDADLEYDPQDYDGLIAPIRRGLADVVYGSRFLGGPHRVLFYWHSVGNWLLTTLSNMFTDLNLTDVWTCYKAFRREALQSITLKEDRFGFEPEITAKVARQRLRVFEVPVSYRGRTYDEGKKITWRDGVWGVYCTVRYGILD
jgi:glycosyltransferase involved in cell wall biosynthesis